MTLDLNKGKVDEKMKRIPSTEFYAKSKHVTTLVDKFRPAIFCAFETVVKQYRRRAVADCKTTGKIMMRNKIFDFHFIPHSKFVFLLRRSNQERNNSINERLIPLSSYNQMNNCTRSHVFKEINRFCFFSNCNSNSGVFAFYFLRRNEMSTVSGTGRKTNVS